MGDRSNGQDLLDLVEERVVAEAGSLAEASADVRVDVCEAESPRVRAERVLKRLVDLGVASIALALASPIIGVLALGVRRDGGPAFYHQERVGRDGEPFRIIKLRSMVVGAEEVITSDPELRERFLRNYALINDPRITPLGKKLRATYLDELPQLINVLRGEMSLVGPRPVLYEETLRYADLRDTILSVRPGMTGWWQWQRTGDTTYDKRIDMEAWYVRNWSLALDCGIVLGTAVDMMKLLAREVLLRGSRKNNGESDD